MARQKPIMRSPSKAPSAWPPTLRAVTKRRTGNSSTSSNPQMARCNSTAVENSACSVRGRTRITCEASVDIAHNGTRRQVFRIKGGRRRVLRAFRAFGVLPQALHLVHTGLAQALARCGQTVFDVFKAPTEFRIR